MASLSDLKVGGFCAQVGKNADALRSQAKRFRLLEEDLLAVNDAVEKGIALAQSIIKSLGEIGQLSRLEIAVTESLANRERSAQIPVENARAGETRPCKRDEAA
jgi:hypothetical protein